MLLLEEMLKPATWPQPPPGWLPVLERGSACRPSTSLAWWCLMRKRPPATWRPRASGAF